MTKRKSKLVSEEGFSKSVLDRNTEALELYKEIDRLLKEQQMRLFFWVGIKHILIALIQQKNIKGALRVFFVSYAETFYRTKE